MRLLRRLACELAPGWHPGYRSTQITGAVADHIARLYTATTFERWYVQLSIYVAPQRGQVPVRFFTRPRCIRCGAAEL